jgi:Tfp pilus assembly protein PilF
MDSMKKVVQLQPDNADAYNYIGYSFADKGINLDEARKDVETALKIEPENSYYLDSLGWVFYQKAQYQDARQQFEKAIKFLKTTVKDDAVIYEHLAETLIKLGLKDEAADKWEKASKLDPENKKYLEKIQKDKPSSSL